MQETKRQKYNSNNGWGFGGKMGTYYYYDNDLRYFKGVYCYRHTGTSSANQWSILDPESDYIPIEGKKSNEVFLYEVIVSGENDYKKYYASFKERVYSDPNITKQTLIKTVKFDL